eukprot:CAMPEP_0182572608 /NCGR_PEP_ID=MMETSP1324-20130603/17781_1 /TAXON_ID=236786 /ORGANISM="Florenciella sp., Strain RCC1587" /LENGTH=57 /DNA_ID=CAMNT_0024787587 /DNA_START=13 /DNA_END=183 /DNA_ORIENTATION=+
MAQLGMAADVHHPRMRAIASLLLLSAVPAAECFCISAAPRPSFQQLRLQARPAPTAT